MITIRIRKICRSEIEKKVGPIQRPVASDHSNIWKLEFYILNRQKEMYAFNVSVIAGKLISYKERNFLFDLIIV